MTSRRPVCEAGFGRAVISPPHGIALAGYFNPRFNRGILDDLHARACLFRQGDTVAGLLQLDLLEIPLWLCRAIRDTLRDQGRDWAGNLIIAATHTHTAPETRVPRDDRHRQALDRVVTQAVDAIEAACADLAPADLGRGRIVNNPFAFNRRYWMRDGRVVTNPGKCNPDIVRPEGPVDREIDLLRVERHGRLDGLVVTLVNHTDTIGGDLVSADWPGFLERRLRAALGRAIPVLVFVGASGNINHFDVTSEQDQTCYDEARRIGEGYADIILRSLEESTPIAAPALSFRASVLPVRKREISAAEIEAAKQRVAEPEKDDGVFTSEDLACGAAPVLRFFARELLRFAEREAGKTVEFDVMALGFGREFALVSLPGEPFTEIGLAIRAASPFAQTGVITNANGYAGYVVPDELFDHGGYEPLPIEEGGPDRNTANAMIRVAGALLDDLGNSTGPPCNIQRRGL